MIKQNCIHSIQEKKNHKDLTKMAQHDKKEWFLFPDTL